MRSKEIIFKNQNKRIEEKLQSKDDSFEILIELQKIFYKRRKDEN